MQNKQTLADQIHLANITVHRFEAKYYELLHPEVYSKREQNRIATQLKTIDREITKNKRFALDVGAGTGNLTGKLLRMGYKVTATDISPEMCAILRKKYQEFLPNRLDVVNSPIEELTFSAEEFDLVATYSVLHHLPDYGEALKTLVKYLKVGGVIYIDHEASPFYWANEPSFLANLVKGLYFHSNPTLNSLYFQLIGLRVPAIDYTFSDYWHKKEHALNHQAVGEVFRELGFTYFKRTDYYQTASWLPNPLSTIYRLLCSPEMSFWVAKK